MRWWLGFALNNFAASKSRMRIRNAKDMQRFLALLEGSAFSAKRWQLILKMPAPLATQWKAVAQEIGVGSVRESPGGTSTQEALHTPTNWGRGHAEIFIRETRFDSKPLGDAARVNAAGYLGYAVQMAAIMSQSISDASTC